MTPAPAAPPPGIGADDGLVLVAVIWLLTLLGGLTMAMSLFTTSALSTIDIYRDRPRTDAAIQAGLSQAVAAILLQNPPAPGAGRLSVGGAAVSFAWVGETARIDINWASPDLLAGLFTRLGASSDAAAAYAGIIVGQRGLSTEAPQPASSAQPGIDADETPAAIEAAAHRLDPKPDPHRPFVDVLQLGQIPGLSAEMMARAAPFLTTFSGHAEIDARLAAPEVLEALPGVTRERLRALLALRDSGPDPAGLADALGDARPFTTTEPASATRINVRAMLPDGFKAAASIVIVHYAEDRQPYRVVSWDDEDAVRFSPSTGRSP